MCELNIWNQAKELNIQTSADITGGFSISFDSKIDEATRDLLMDFAYWAEDNYHMPVTLWVDFKYRHYLLDDNRKPVPYRFYSVPFCTFPVFDNWDDLPVIHLAARRERRTGEEIILAFIRAVTEYYRWLSGTAGCHDDENLVRAIYWQYQESYAGGDRHA